MNDSSLTVMDNYTAVAITEGFQEPDCEQQLIDAWQHLVDTGLCWQLQGTFGRTAHELIQNGIINPPSQGLC